MSGKIVRTSNITQSAVGNKDGLWTTVVAAGVFINDDNSSVETGQSQGDVACSNEILNQDEVSRQVPEARDPPPRRPEESFKQSDEKTGRQLNATHDQQEVKKALFRVAQQQVAPSPGEKDTPTAADDRVIKAGHSRLSKPL